MLTKIALLAAALIGGVAALAQNTPSDVRSVEAAYLQRAAANIETYRKGDAEIQLLGQDGAPVRNASVAIDQVRHQFLFGCLLPGPSMAAEQRKLYDERFLAVFNFGVMPFYWLRYERLPGKPNWQANVDTAEWCRRNGVVAKGHPLVWVRPGSGFPEWLARFPAEVQEELLKARVINTVAGFAGEVDVWDVTNESVHKPTWAEKDNVPSAKDSEPTTSGLADYIEKALRWAYLANPKATLIVNEYSMISNRDPDSLVPRRKLPPRDRLIAVAKELEKRGAPPFDVGFQAHVPHDEWFAPEEVWTACDALQKMGRRIHMTEFIPQSSGKAITGRWRTGTWTEEAQGEFGEQFLRLSFGHPAVASVHFWGLSDRNIWLPGGGLVDKEYRPKPIYERVRRLIREEWMTRNLSLRTDERGRVKFRGFFGTYRVHVSAPMYRETDFDLNLTAGPTTVQFKLDRRR